MPLLRPLPLLGLLFCATPASTPVPSAQPEAPAPQATKPTLLVFITVDQMRADYLDKWKSQFTSGLKRLVDGGALFTNAHQDHAITETAPGHASTMSGRFPRSTGISRNLEGVNDSTPLLANAMGLGASPARFRGTTLTDWLTSADPKTRALSVSYKDRGAILPIGRSKQDVYWYSPSGIFTSSRWYRDSLPGWVTAYNATYGKRYAGRVWTLLLPESAYPEPDSVAVEGSGRFFQFPYPLSASPDTVTRQLPNTPFLDEATAGLALVGLEALGLGKGPQTDVLAVSFSATDLIGHRWGPDSRELVVRDHVADRAAHELLGRHAEQARSGRVDVQVATLAIGDENAVDGLFDEGLVVLVLGGFDPRHLANFDGLGLLRAG